MDNFILFMNSFLSYLLLFVFIVILVVIACFVGIYWKKTSDKKMAGGADGSVMPDEIKLEKE